MSNPGKWPTTVKATVKDLIAGMSEADKEALRKSSKDDLIQFHFGWGTYIRNHYGLWQGNDELLRDACGDTFLCDPDYASERIIETVWKALRSKKT